jgi:hypothetical protein
VADPMMAGAMPPQAAPPQGAAVDPAADPNAAGADETEIFETIVAGLTEHMYGKAMKGIVKTLRDSKNPARDAGTIAFQYVQTAAKQTQAAGHEVDLDMLLGVATEVIESLMKMAQAAKVKIKAPKQFMTEALFTAIQAYLSTVEPGSEESEAAKGMLAEMQANGTVRQGAQALQELGAEAGVDPFAESQQQQAPPQDAVPAGPGLIGGAA